MKDLRVGTRGSPLALWQANEVASRIQQAGGPQCHIVVIKTSGDRLQDAPLSEAGGKRLFVKEIEDALLGGDVDVAVHSSKDMPAVLPAGLTIGAVLPREDPLDAVVLPRHVTLNTNAELGDASVMPEASGVSRTVDRIDQLFALLGDAPVIGTGSVRRVAQLKRLFPHALFKQIRGNLDTRLRKLDNGEYDAVVLAAAGLRRLGLASRIALRIPAPSCLPAPGQGIIAIEIREADEDTRRAVGPINDAVTGAALRGRAGGRRNAGRRLPDAGRGARVARYPDEIELLAVVVSLDGSRAIYGMAHGMRDQAAAIGARVGTQLLADGAGEILAEAGRHDGDS